MKAESGQTFRHETIVGYAFATAGYVATILRVVAAPPPTGVATDVRTTVRIEVELVSVPAMSGVTLLALLSNYLCESHCARQRLLRRQFNIAGKQPRKQQVARPA